MAKHVLIVGAGVIGLSTAYYCARQRPARDGRGPPAATARRMLVRQRRHGCAQPFRAAGRAGSRVAGTKVDVESGESVLHPSAAELGAVDVGLPILAPATDRHVQQAAPLLRDLNLASRTCYAELAGLAGDQFGLVQHGLLMLCKTQHALDEEIQTAALARQLNLPAEVLDPAATAQLDPQIRMDIRGSVYFPWDCHLSPARLMHWLQQQLTDAGIDLVWNCQVTGWCTRARHVDALHTSSGPLDADEYVICGGAWSPHVVRGLGLKLPMQAGKGYSLTLTHPRQLPRICAILTEARVAVTPLDTALRLAGTMEIAGVDFASTPGASAASSVRCRNTTLSSRRKISPASRPGAACALLTRRPALYRSHRTIRQSRDRHRPRHDGNQPGPRHRVADIGAALRRTRSPGSKPTEPRPIKP